MCDPTSRPSSLWLLFVPELACLLARMDIHLASSSPAVRSATNLRPIILLVLLTNPCHSTPTL